MKRWGVAGLWCVLVMAAVSAQTTKYGVTATVAKKVDFSTFKTYSWTKTRPSSIPEIDEQIVAAVDQQLQGLGLSLSTSAPGDVLATYTSLSRTDANVKTKREGTNQLAQHTVGTLVVAMLEPVSRRELLRLRLDKPIDTDPATLNATVTTAVAELFQHYPTRPK